MKRREKSLLMYFCNKLKFIFDNNWEMVEIFNLKDEKMCLLDYSHIKFMFAKLTMDKLFADVLNDLEKYWREIKEQMPKPEWTRTSKATRDEF